MSFESGRVSIFSGVGLRPVPNEKTLATCCEPKQAVGSVMCLLDHGGCRFRRLHPYHFVRNPLVHAVPHHQATH